MRISDWSSDVCSSDLGVSEDGDLLDFDFRDIGVSATAMKISRKRLIALDHSKFASEAMVRVAHLRDVDMVFTDAAAPARLTRTMRDNGVQLFVAETEAEPDSSNIRSEEHTSELQSLMRSSYAV